VKTAVEYIIRGSSTHVKKNNEKKKIRFVDRTEDSSHYTKERGNET
jgi:hypothetical protein